MEGYKLGDVIYVHDNHQDENDWNPWAVIVFDNDFKETAALCRNGGIYTLDKVDFSSSEHRLEGNINIQPHILDKEMWLKDRLYIDIKNGTFVV